MFPPRNASILHKTMIEMLLKCGDFHRPAVVTFCSCLLAPTKIDLFLKNVFFLFLENIESVKGNAQEHSMCSSLQSENRYGISEPISASSLRYDTKQMLRRQPFAKCSSQELLGKRLNS